LESIEIPPFFDTSIVPYLWQNVGF